MRLLRHPRIQRPGVALALALAAICVAPPATANSDCDFYNPSVAQSQRIPGHAGNPVHELGSVLPMSWTTAANMTNYTIALWQQNPEGGSAFLGPVVFEPLDVQAFQLDWTVQLYTLSLSYSPIFFFWLHEGPASLQGSTEGRACTSHYFNVTRKGETTSTTTTVTSSTTTSSSSSTASTTAVIPAASGTGLSTATEVGIGVGVGIVALAAVAALILWYRHLQAKQAGAAPLPNSSTYSQLEVAYSSGDSAMGNHSRGNSPSPLLKPQEMATPAPESRQGSSWSGTAWLRKQAGYRQHPVEMGPGTSEHGELA